MGVVKEKSDRDSVRAQISAGGWVVAWGDLINEFDVAMGAFSTVVPAIGISAFVTQQIQAQITKFGQSMNDISPEIRRQVESRITEIVKKGIKGEWNVGGIGVKGGVATYHRHWKVPPFGGWNKLPPNFQPYIGFRIASRVSMVADSAEAEEVQIIGSTADSGPTESPSSPPPSPIGTYEDVNLGLSKEELDAILAKDVQEPLPPSATES